VEVYPDAGLLDIRVHSGKRRGHGNLQENRSTFVEIV
jgi:hypothetical protein